jgi:hypothetical protein
VTLSQPVNRASADCCGASTGCASPYFSSAVLNPLSIAAKQGICRNAQLSHDRCDGQSALFTGCYPLRALALMSGLKRMATTAGKSLARLMLDRLAWVRSLTRQFPDCLGLGAADACDWQENSYIPCNPPTGIIGRP